MQELIKETTRRLRKTQTPSERILWQILRNRKLAGYKIIRQHAIVFDYNGAPKFYVADFYCHAKKLVIEVDGKIHEKQMERDKFRTYIINQLGIQVIRIKNEELKNIPEITAKIRLMLQ